MDMYKLNENKVRYQSPGYLGKYARNAHRPYSPNPGAGGITLQRSPSQLMIAQVMEAPQVVGVSDSYQDFFSMNSDLPSALHEINESKLATILRKSLQRENFHF